MVNDPNEGEVIVFSKPARPPRRKRHRHLVDERGCCCANCQRDALSPITWPRHMVGIPPRRRTLQDAGESPNFWMSYECHVERQDVDPEFEEILNQLRNDPPRNGSVLIADRAHSKPR